MQNIPQGQKFRLEHVFYDGEGNLVDPEIVRFSILTEADGGTDFFEYDTGSSVSDNSSDDDSADPGTVVRDSTGRYHVDVDTSSQSGVYNWRVRSEGPIDAAQGQFYVEPALVDDESSDDSVDISL